MFVFGNAHGRVSAKRTILPIWITDAFRPVRVRLIEGVGWLLLCLDIVKKLDITVVFGCDHFRVGQGELEMMTYNEKHHWVFPLFPTACAYAKLGDYFWEMRKGQIEVLHVRGDFGRHSEVRKVNKTKSRSTRESWGNPNRSFRKWKHNSKYLCAYG